MFIKSFLKKFFQTPYLSYKNIGLILLNLAKFYLLISSLIVIFIFMLLLFGFYEYHAKAIDILINLDTFNFDRLYVLCFSNNFIYIIYKLYIIFKSYYMVLDLSDFIFFESVISLYWYVDHVELVFFYSDIINFILYSINKLFYIFINLPIYLYNLIIDLYDIFINFDKLDLPLFYYFTMLFISSTIISLVFTSYLGLYGVFFINLITISLLWLSTVIYIDFFFLQNNLFKINLGKWFVIFLNKDIYFELLIDSISYSFMLLTITIATFVYIYIFSYFRYDANVERLTILINLFVISMVLLVSSGNFFVMFLGWELIGLTSFLLINFWSTRISTLKSAFKAYVFNKFSDVSILIAILLSIIIIGDANILTFNNHIAEYQNHYLCAFDLQISIIEIISFFFISSAFIKSAQFGTHIWLPDSMEAPVPASALIHSATLVSAGVFLLLRLSPLFELSTYAYIIIPLVGSFTAFFGGLCAAYQSDIKRILAYSTISHCGFLMVCYSTYVPEFTILYLYIHGFFKAAVFLCAGNVIRFSKNYQDFRRMGGFWKYLPFECFCSFICLINLCGMPFSIGFYIKHLILLGVNLDYFFLNFILVNILGGALFGIFYSYKFFYYAFFDIKKGKKNTYMSTNRSILKSIFYSNTSLASNISISLLIFSSYLISLYLLNLFLNKSSVGEGLDIYSNYSSSYLEYSLPTTSVLLNIGFFNWLLIIIIVIVVYSSWRNVFNSFVIFKKLNFLLSLTFYLFLFYLFLI